MKKDKLDLLGEALTCGETAELYSHLARECHYYSESSGKCFNNSDDIIAFFSRKKLQNIDNSLNTYKKVSLNEISIIKKECDENALLLYQFDERYPMAVVTIKTDEIGLINDIYLSRDGEKYNVVFYDDIAKLDVPSTVNPLSPKELWRNQMSKSFCGQEKEEESNIDKDGLYVWRKANEYWLFWLDNNGYNVEETKIFSDCIGYRCNRKGFEYTIYMFARGPEMTIDLNGDYCSKLLNYEFSKNSIVLVASLNVKRKVENGEILLTVCNHYESEEKPKELWRVTEIGEETVLEFYPRKEMCDIKWKLIYAFNRENVDVFDCITACEGFEFEDLNGDVYKDKCALNKLKSLHQQYGNMKYGYVSFDEVIYSAVPYIYDYGYFGFTVNNRNKIIKIVAYPYSRCENGDFLYLELLEDEHMYNHVPELVSVESFPPVKTERFALKLTYDSGEIVKFVLPINIASEDDEIIEFCGYIFTDGIFSSCQVQKQGKANRGTTIQFKNGFEISALQCYEEGQNYTEPILSNRILYEDEAVALKENWFWDVVNVYEDEKTEILRVLIRGEAFNFNGRSTLVHRNGKRATSLEFDYLDHYDEGYSLVRKDGFGYGYIDDKAKVAIPFKYEIAESFRNGKARVYNNGEWFFVDKTGNETHIHNKNHKYEEICDYFEGLCRVSTKKLRFTDLAYHSDYEHLAGVWGYINENGEEIISPQYIYACDFEDGLAFVCKGEWTKDEKWNNKYNTGRYWTEEELWGAIDKSGREIIPCKFDEIKNFWDTTEVFMAHYGGWEKGGWGIIDHQGNWLVDPIFEYIGSEYCDGLFKSCSFNQDEDECEPPFGIYDLKQGKVLFEPQFSDVSFAENGLLSVEVYDEKLNRTVEKIIDREGKEQFYSEYSLIYIHQYPHRVEIFSEGESRSGLIDREGKVVVPCIYNTPYAGICCEKNIIVFIENEKMGLKNLKGETIVPAIYDKIEGTREPLLTVTVKEGKNDKKGLININGDVILPVEYEEIRWTVDNKHLILKNSHYCSFATLSYKNGKKEVSVIEAL